MTVVTRPDGSKVLEIPVFCSNEGEVALDELIIQIRMRFRCVDGQPRAFMDQGRTMRASNAAWWPRVIYTVYQFAAEQNGDSQDWGPNLVAAMQYLFEEFYARGARVVVWRRHMALEWASGGQLVPNKQSIGCRCAFLDDNCVTIEPGEFARGLTKNEGMPMPMLTEEVLRDVFSGRPPTVTPAS